MMSNTTRSGRVFGHATRLAPRRQAWTALLVLALVAACGDGDDRPKITVAKDNFCGEVADVVCENMFACCTGAEIEKVLGLTITTSESACRRDVSLACQAGNAGLMHGLKKGTVSVNEAAATSCLEALMVQDVCFTSAAIEPWKTPCYGNEDTVSRNLFTGMLAAGADCLFDVECAPDHRCNYSRKCEALPKTGQPCLPPGICAKDHYCDSKTNQCKPSGKAGNPCTTSMECARKHFCELAAPKPPDPPSGTCKALLSAGASCSGDSQCDSSYCTPGKCANGQKCYKDDQCEGTCKSKPTTNCSEDSQCGGKCATSQNNCMNDNNCDTSTSEKCVLDTCQKGACTPKPTCTDAYKLINYCNNSSKLFLGSP